MPRLTLTVEVEFDTEALEHHVDLVTPAGWPRNALARLRDDVGHEVCRLPYVDGCVIEPALEAELTGMSVKAFESED